MNTKYISLTLAFWAICLIAACGHTDTPSEVAEKFITAFTQKDYVEASKYAAKSAQTGLSMMPRSGTQGFPLKIEMLQEVHRNDTAIVYYKVGYVPRDLKLVQEDGEWKVILAKN